MQPAICPDHAAQRSRHFCFRRLSACVMLLAFMLLLGSGCITAPPKKITAAERARQENAIGTKLSRQFESKLHFRTDPLVDRYLQSLAQTLAKPTGDVRLMGTSVVVIQDRLGQWRSYSLPGRRTYLSLGLLQQLHYDNEVASVVALEFGNIVLSHALNHLKNGQKTDFFSPEGIFSFDVEEMKASISEGIDILYRAGFDIRGMIRIWEVFQANPDHSPFPSNVVNELAEFTRETISRYSPLRNPIVRTEEFKTVHKRILKL